MSELVRTRCGQFKLDSSITLDEAKELAAQKKLSSALISINQALAHMPQIIVSEEAVTLIRNGVTLTVGSILELSAEFVGEETLLRMLSPQNELLSIGKALQTIPPSDSETPILHPQIVFPKET